MQMVAGEAYNIIHYLKEMPLAEITGAAANLVPAVLLGYALGKWNPDYFPGDPRNSLSLTYLPATPGVVNLCINTAILLSTNILLNDFGSGYFLSMAPSAYVASGSALVTARREGNRIMERALRTTSIEDIVNGVGNSPHKIE